MAFRPLTQALTRCGGRNHHGRTTVYHRGGGARPRLRWLLSAPGPLLAVAGYVVRTEFHPRRPLRPVLLVAYRSGYLAYRRSTLGLAVGSLFRAEPTLFVRSAGSSYPLSLLPPGSPVHELALRSGRGPQLLRAAGSAGRLLRHYGGGLVLVQLPSGQRRLLPPSSWAVLGRSAGGRGRYLRRSSAGQVRHCGRRPVVRGVAMNPVDHPHGGGQGKTSGGQPSVTPWGRPTKGGRTRSPARPSNRYILR